MKGKGKDQKYSGNKGGKGEKRRNGPGKFKRAVWKDNIAEKGKNLFGRLSGTLMDLYRPEYRTGASQKMNADILALSGGRREAIREYYEQKTERLLKSLLVFGCAAAAILIVSLLEDRSIPEGKLDRPGYGQGTWNEELKVEIDLDQSQNEERYEDQTEELVEAAREILREGTTVQLDIPERRFTSGQVKELLEKAEGELQTVFLGQNTSADEVRSPLVLPTSLAGGYVLAEWTVMPYGIIEDTGILQEGIPEEGALVTLEADLSLQDRHRIVTFSVRAFPPERTPSQEAALAVSKEADRVNENRKNDEYYLLPQKLGNLNLKWSYAEDSSLMIVALLLLMIPFLLGALSDQKVREAAFERRLQLEMDYPEIMWKMTLLIGAGMNLSSAFFRISDDYQKEQKRVRTLNGNRKTWIPNKNIDKKRYVYEEMLITCYEIRDGMSEGKAYENFGHRCALPRYIRMGSILSQNLRKGSGGLTQILEQEALSASQERQAQARKLGEKAGTKLLLPMVMMLCVVFVILVVPAFLVM